MTLTQAIKTLKHHQAWRKGADIKPTQPKELSAALDVAIHQLQQIQRSQDDGN